MKMTALAAAALASALGLTVFAPLPAAADGAASTRNILFGAAAAGVGTWAIINHNAKVHQKEAEQQQATAEAQAQANQTQAAYESERQAYKREAALVREYQKEVAYQHDQVRAQQKQIASLERSHMVAKTGGTVVAQARLPQPIGGISYGWGTF